MEKQEIIDDFRRNGINRWFFEIPLEDVKTTVKDTTTADCCFLCGKKIVEKSEYMVHYLNTGNLMSSMEPFKESQGFFPIGSECRKMLPNNFYFKKNLK